ncbi:hypothetical protein Csa_002800 [Cucumis sativus]|uniref:Uncharacterized protein n=1 Tax=Cucumis sativus TaxID=3659 RepID=A0A0A0KL72_CUCSA|nr:hypothetical protein Csa_002800 [Cucumis sativus]
MLIKYGSHRRIQLLEEVKKEPSSVEGKLKKDEQQVRCGCALICTGVAKAGPSFG